MRFTFSILVLIVCLVAAFHYWNLFARSDEERKQVRRWLSGWAVKGLAVPLLLWFFFNLGLAPGMAALLPPIAAARAVNGHWILLLLRLTDSAVCVVSTCWAAVTFSQLLPQLAGRIDARARSEFRWVIGLWSMLMLPVAAVILWSGGWLAIGFAVLVVLLPMAHFGVPLLDYHPLPPSYAGAIAKMKFGKYTEAEREIIQELEQSENDFNGWMMLAELYAKNFNDLAAAEQTVHDLCDQPATTPSEVSVALHRLADWHLKMGGDPLSARRALEEISLRFPGTHLDRMARLRQQQLPRSREDLRKQREGKTIRLPALSDDFDRVNDTAVAALDNTTAVARARECVEKLKQDPNLVPAREELAGLLAERVGQVEDGIQQLELLVAMPDQPETKTAEWLARMASWHVKYRRDDATARELLQRIVRDFPQSLHAFAAQRRLRLMEVEQRRRNSSKTTPSEPNLTEPIESHTAL